MYCYDFKKIREKIGTFLCVALFIIGIGFTLFYGGKFAIWAIKGTYHWVVLPSKHEERIVELEKSNAKYRSILVRSECKSVRGIEVDIYYGKTYCIMQKDELGRVKAYIQWSDSDGFSGELQR